jgi:hypothetical protein
LHSRPRFQRAAIRSAAARFKYNGRTSMALNQHAEAMSVHIDIFKCKAPKIHSQQDRQAADGRSKNY